MSVYGNTFYWGSFIYAAQHQFSDFELFILDTINVCVHVCAGGAALSVSVDLFIAASTHQKVLLSNTDKSFFFCVCAGEYPFSS